MASSEDVLGLLKVVGAVEIGGANMHPKFKLPTGRIFTFASSASDHRSHDNALAYLRRELRTTHPEAVAASRKGYTPPKIKRSAFPIRPGTTSLASLMSADQLRQLGVSEKPTFVPMSATVIEPKTHPTYVETLPPYIPPRKPRSEPTARHGEVKTFTQAQLDEANKVMKTEGEAGLKTFCNSHRQELVPVTEEIAQARVPEPPPTPKEPAKMNTPIAIAATTVATATVDQMKREAAQVKINILRLQDEKETEEIKLMQLEDFIVRHDKLMADYASISQLLKPVSAEATIEAKQPTEVLQMPEPLRKHDVLKGQPRDSSKFAGAKEVREIVIPKFRGEGKTLFTVDDVIEVLKKDANGKQIPERSKMYNSVYIYARVLGSGYTKSPKPNMFELTNAKLADGVRKMSMVAVSAQQRFAAHA